jgi:hypothetical protein
VNAGSGSCLRAAEPYVQTDATDTRLAQRHKRALLDPAVSGLRVAYDLTRVADCLEIASDDFVKRRSFRASDLDEAFRGAASATSATIRATSSAAMG